MVEFYFYFLFTALFGPLLVGGILMYDNNNCFIQ